MKLLSIIFRIYSFCFLFYFWKITTFLQIIKLQIFLFRPLVGWWVGKAEKWRSPFLGVGWRCGVSVANTAKANYLKNTIAPLFSFFALSSYI